MSRTSDPVNNPYVVQSTDDRKCGKCGKRISTFSYIVDELHVCDKCFEVLSTQKSFLSNVDQTSWPLEKVGCWAPGYYTCKCSVCGIDYMGDKRSYHCYPCAKALEEAENKNVYGLRYFAIDPIAPRVCDRKRLCPDGKGGHYYYIMAVATTMEDAELIAEALNNKETEKKRWKNKQEE